MSEPKIRLSQISPSATGTDSISGNVTISNDLTVGGNLVVSGNTTTLNVETLLIEDNEIILNSNVASTPTLNAQITVNRGSSSNAFLLWDESADKWGWSDDGANVTQFANALLKTGDTMTGELNVANNLVVTGNVGIGTANPDSKFHVYAGTNEGTVILAGRSDWTANSGEFNVGNIFGKNIGGGINSTRIKFDGDDTTGTISFWTANGGSLGMRMHIANGNIGIGTTTPTAPLQIVADGPGGVGILNLRGSNSHLGLANTSGTFRGWFGYFNTSNHGSEADLNIKTGYNGASNIRISADGDGTAAQVYIAGSTGSVGIGTTNPSTKLHVQGSIRAGIAGNSTANFAALEVAASGTANEQAAIAIQQVTSEGDTIIFADYEPYVEYGISTENNSNLIQFTGGDPTNSLGSKTLYNRSGSARTAQTKFQVNLDNGTTSIGGNVGIGITNPDQSLAFVDSLGVKIQFNGTNNNGYQVGLASSVNGGDAMMKFTAGETGAGEFGFYNTTNLRLLIANNGNVGIGTTNPTEKLYVTGTVGVSNYQWIKGQTTNGQSFFQFEGATYRNPGDHTPEFLVRADNSTTGLSGFRPALALYNNNGGDQTTVGLTFVSAEGATGAGNSVNLAGIIAKKESAGTVGAWSPGSLTFFVKNFGTRVDAMTIASGGAVTIPGSLSKGSGSFKIDHPLPEKSNTHHLVHSFIEGPQADLIYRGKTNLINGSATINIDTHSGMTEGTFVALCRDVQCFTSNESDWDNVRGSVSGNTLTIECQNPNSNATISWMVIGERQDKHMYDTEWTDENGKVIVEPEKINSESTTI